jgi:hypothetical protein
MKPSIIVRFVAVSTWACASWADSGATAPASATLAWNRVALEAVERTKPTQHQAARLLAHVSLAQHAALAETGNQKAAHDAIASASMQVIADLLPSQAAFVEERYRQLRPQAGNKGLHAAQRALAHAHSDGFAQTWSGAAPQAAYAWRSLANPPVPPAYPAIGAMRTFFIESGSAFRPGPPPEVGSAQFLDDVAEVRRHTQAPTEESARIAKFYDMTTGTLAAGFWNEQAAGLIRRDALGELQATRILATVNAAMMDAFVACHDAKYTYWVPRPSQVDPSIKPLIKVPNHPSYPSNHSCISTTAALVLAHFFPQDRDHLEGIAKEAGMSRIYAGLHYGFDVDAGEEIGRKVATVAVARHTDMLSRWTRTLVSAF